MDENFYNVEKCCDEILTTDNKLSSVYEIREMISTLSNDFSYDTILCAMEEVINNG